MEEFGIDLLPNNWIDFHISELESEFNYAISCFNLKTQNEYLSWELDIKQYEGIIRMYDDSSFIGLRSWKEINILDQLNTYASHINDETCDITIQRSAQEISLIKRYFN